MGSYIEVGDNKIESNSAVGVFKRLSKSNSFFNRTLIYLFEGNFTLLVFSVMTDISTSSFGMGAVKIVSYVLSWLLLITFLTVYINLFQRVYKTKNFRESDYFQSYNPYFSDLGENSKMNHLFGLFKKAIIIACIIFLSNYRDAQIYTVFTILILF